MNVVDSCAWLEYFADGANAAFFARAIENTRKLIVPTLSLYEVFKRVLQQRNESDALQAVAVMQQGTIVALDGRIELPMADSVMLATARAFGATLWTQDDDFKGLSGIQYRPARR